MSRRPIFLRPIYFGTTAPQFVYNSNNITIDTGVYGSILTFAKELETQIKAVDANFRITISSDFKLLFYSTIAYTLTASDSDDYDILGLTGAINSFGSVDYEPTNTPLHMWLPTYEQANQSEMSLKHVQRFSGRTSVDGAISGIKLDGGDVYHKQLEFNFEPAANIKRAMSTDSYIADRSLDAFFDGARWSTPGASGNVATTGLYYYPDYTDADLTDDMTTNEGVNYYYSSSPDTHTFCHLNPDSISTPTPALPTTRQSWNVSFAINSATAPIWTAG